LLVEFIIAIFLLLLYYAKINKYNLIFFFTDEFLEIKIYTNYFLFLFWVFISIVPHRANLKLNKIIKILKLDRISIDASKITIYI
jgi:hypothetical protein